MGIIKLTSQAMLSKKSPDLHLCFSKLVVAEAETRALLVDFFSQNRHEPALEGHYQTPSTGPRRHLPGKTTSESTAQVNAVETMKQAEGVAIEEGGN